MLIDFHTHYFPDKIARESCDKLAHAAGVPYYGDGTLAGLVKFMREDGVDISVNAPVATRPEQVQGINRKMIEFNKAGGPVICLGAMHPGFAGYKEELALLKANGVRGIKMHPEYQQFCPGDRTMFGLYEACAENDIFVLFHSGVDIGYSSVHCTPESVKKLSGFGGLTVVLAHMGAYRLWDEVEKQLVGENFYFDIAYCGEMDDGQLKRMITNHGSDKVLFATDFPWERASVIKKKVEGLGLPREDLDNIYFKNASKLLKI